MSEALVVDGFRVEPPVLLADGQEPLTWDAFHPDGDGWAATASDDGRLVAATVRIGSPQGHPATADARWMPVRWRLTALQPMTVAFELPVVLPVDPGPRTLFVPGIHDDLEEPGAALHPWLDLGRGFALRADRLPQVAILVGDAQGVRGLVLDDEAPRPATPGLCLALTGGSRQDDAIRLAIRYPQAEWGHVGDPPSAAYVAKGVVGAGEDRRVRLEAGDRLRVAARLLRQPGGGMVAARALPARRQWHGWRTGSGTAGPGSDASLDDPRWPRRSASGRGWAGPLAPFDSARLRSRWVDAHLWSPSLGQYASPEGAQTALAGFIEMSLTLAANAARLALLAGDAEAAARPLAAVDAWVRDGCTSDGLVLPVRDPEGFRAGRRRYAEGARLEVTREHVVEPIRVLAEARSLLALARMGAGTIGASRIARYRGVAASTARVLLDRVGAAGLPGVLSLDREAPAAADGAATAHLVALLADLALDAPATEAADAWAVSATGCFDRWLGPGLAAGRSGGITLDAGCPDREGVHAALEAALLVAEVSEDGRRAAATRLAVGQLLPWVFTYPVRTFTPETDAAVRRILTTGASVVSSENQHLDPFPVGSALLRAGLVTDDGAALAAGLANLAWCLDGRWAFDGPDGVRQSEQLNHTRWHYNAYFATRGDLRRGMPYFGRTDSEHGWAQALPVAAYLEVGDVTIDWPSGRATSLDPAVAVAVKRDGRGLHLQLHDRRQPATTRLIRLLRPPRDQSLELVAGDRRLPLPWPRPMAAFAVPAGERAFELRVRTDPSARR